MTVRIDGLATTGPGPLPRQRASRLFLVAQLAWVALIGLLVVLFAISIPSRYDQLRHPPASVQLQLAQAGLSAVVYATYLTALQVVFAIICGAAATLIARYRWHDPIGLLASLFLMLIGLASPPVMDGLIAGFPSLARLANATNFLFSLFLLAFFFLFPDGRFVPRWSRIPVLAGCAAAMIACIVTNPSVADPPGWMGLMMVGGTVAGIAAQVYRYFKVSNPVERQQTKWVSLGVGGAIVTSIVIGFGGSLIPSIGAADTGYGLTGLTSNAIAYFFIPVTICVAVLRYRLWDIDVVVNRTLVYGALTIGLLALYLGLTEGLGALIQTGRLPLSLVATALVAVLFAPLRHRLQAAINRLMYGERDDPYRVLTRLGERIGATISPDAVLPAIAETVAHALKSSHVAITLKQVQASAASREPGVGAPLRLPVAYQGETVGELLVTPRGPGEEFSPADRQLLDDLARQIGPAVHAVRLAADLQRSRERLVTAREEERRRLRRDLHDGLGPQLAALTLKIETIRNRFAPGRELDAALTDLTERTQAALSDIRRLVYGLRPPTLDELGLIPAIQQTAAQYSDQGDKSLQITVDAPPALPPLPAAVEVAAYRIVQEALVNVVRHAAAVTCQVSLSLDDDRVRLQISDDGRGVDASHRIGVGLRSMRERAEELGGSWSVASPASGGTIIAVTLPRTLAGPPGTAGGMEGSGGSNPNPDRG